MAIDTIPVGGYANVTEVISAAAQTAVLAEINKFIALIPAETGASTDVHGVAPFYDFIPPPVASALRTELAALKTAIDAAPTA